MDFLSRVTKVAKRGFDSMRDEWDKPETFGKGEEFEKYVRKHLFTRDRYTLLHQTHDYTTSKADYSQETKDPDFKFKAVKTGKEFWVEAKYRSSYYEDKVEWCKPFQLNRYKETDKKLPVYIILGVEGEPDSPDQIFLIPLRDIKYAKLFRLFLKNYRLPNDKPVDCERIQ